MASKYIERKRIMVKMENIERYPLSIVHAPMGYGKTVAVREYLESTSADSVWVSLAGSEGQPDYLWTRLCDALKETDESLGTVLGQSVFLMTVLKQMRCWMFLWITIIKNR